MTAKEREGGDRGVDGKLGGRDAVNSFGKMMVILNCFTREETQLTPAEIAEKAGLPKTTTHRIVSNLRKIGILEQDSRRREYRLGMKLFQLGSTVLASFDFHGRARIHVSRLQQITGESVHLCLFDGSHMVFVDRQQMGATPLNDITTIEGAPTYCTGVGKAFLAYQEDHVVQRIIDEGLTRYTKTTITDPDILKRELLDIRERGYAIDNGEHEDDLRCIAAPIRNSSEQVFAAISTYSTADRFPDSRIEIVASIVIEASEEISRAFGWKNGATSKRKMR